jgi:hypothetical protein
VRSTLIFMAWFLGCTSSLVARSAVARHPVKA